MIALAILAAGESSRLGRPKQLLTHEGRPLIRHVADAALASACRPVLVVLGHQAERIGLGLEGLDVRIVANPEWREGMSSSIRAAVRALDDVGEVDGLVLLTCDQPRISAAVIDGLVRARDEGSRPMAACAYAGTVGVPALFDVRKFDDLRSLRGGCGAKRLLLERPEQVARIDWPDGAIDLDTPGDLDRTDPEPPARSG